MSSIDSRDNLQAEGDIGNLPIILGNTDEAQVGQRTEALQQVLRYPELKIRAYLRSQQVGWVVGGDVGVVESNAHRRTPLKALRVGEVGGVSFLTDDRNRTKNAGGFGVILVELQGAGNDGIEAGNVRADAERGTDQAVRAGAHAAGGYSRASGAGAYRAAEAAHAPAWGVLHDAGVDAENVCPRLRPQVISVGDVEIVAGNIDVEIIFQSEGDGVVNRKIDFAVAHKRIDARRVAQIRLRHLLPLIGPQDMREDRTRLGVILQVNRLWLSGNWRGLRRGSGWNILRAHARL
jgi:hypothetical protein